jgi:hypothetical protein
VCGNPFACGNNQVTLPLPSGSLAGSFFTNGTLNGDFYTNGLACVWNLTAPVGTRLVVWFTLIDVEFQTFCGWVDALAAWCCSQRVWGVVVGGMESF